MTETTRITYVTLDTFMKKPHNIDGALESWLTFLKRDDLGIVMELVNRHPEFAVIYNEIAEFRKAPKEMIGMFSDALKIMDHNTELFMIDEMKEEIKTLSKQINDYKQELQQKDERHQQELQQKDEEIRKMDEEIRKLRENNDRMN